MPKSDEYPVNVVQCQHSGCTNTNTMPCILTAYRGDFGLWHCLRKYGFSAAWHLWREGWVDLPPNYYCAKHAKEEGFCWGCGMFWAGNEQFDFYCDSLCPNCRADESDPDEDWWEEEEWDLEWDWWDDFDY